MFYAKTREWRDLFLPSREMRKNTESSVHREIQIAKAVTTLTT